MANEFRFNWGRAPQDDPYMQTGDLAAMRSNGMVGYVPNSAFTPSYPDMQGYAPNGMQGYHPNSLDPRNAQPVYAQPVQNVAYGASLQAASEAASKVDEIDALIAKNNAEIDTLRKELQQLKKDSAGYADAMDRKLAMNRAKAGDLANAQTHLGRIETRQLAEETRKNALRLRQMEKMGSNQEYDDLMKLAKKRTDLEAVAKDPGLRSGLEREYNIEVQKYRTKYGHDPDFSAFETGVDLFTDRSGYASASDEALAKDKATLDNFVTANTNQSGVWTGSDEDQQRAIDAAKKQGDASLAKQLSNTWNRTQYAKYQSDMDAAGKKALEGLNRLQTNYAKRDGKFTDKDKRTWTLNNGKWSSPDYKWNGKKNGVK